MCSYRIRKDKAPLEKDLLRDMKNNKGFSKCIGQKQKPKENPSRMKE